MTRSRRSVRLACDPLEGRLTPAIDITLSGGSVAEFRKFGSEAGTLSAAEPGAGHTYTFALVRGDQGGTDDNAAFGVSSNRLLTLAPFNAAKKSAYTVRVRAADEAGDTAEAALTVAVTDDPNVSLIGRDGRNRVAAGRVEGDHR